jgi:predicted alpha/beta-fold hydrolase
VAGSLGLNAPDNPVIQNARQPAGGAAPTVFKPAWWCRNPHLQTLWPVFFRRRLRPPLRRERLDLPDGDFVDLDWTLNESGPIVILFHGLEGSSRSHYARGMLSALPRLGMRAVLMHFRGCSGEPNRLARAYHSGDTGDIDFLVRSLKAREPNTPLAAVGYSLGGNALLKWLGEQGGNAPVQCAVAVSVPFLLHESTARMNQGFSRIYQWKLVRDLKRSVLRKVPRLPLPTSASEIEKMQTFRQFDDRVTARLHGFENATHYYTESSSRRYLARIRTPTLIVHAVDDPFMPATVIPTAQELSDSIEFDLSQYGGHVGFVSGRNPLRPDHWLDRRIPEWLLQRFNNSSHR